MNKKRCSTIERAIEKTLIITVYKNITYYVEEIKRNNQPEKKEVI